MKVLSSLFEYAGKYKYLTILSLLFSAISATFLLIPFIYIFKIVDELIKIYPHFSSARHIVTYGWVAFGGAVTGILLYVVSLLCSHLAAFRIASNMRKKAMHHVFQLPMGYLETEGSGKVRKIIDEAAGATETFLAHQLPDMIQMIVTVIIVFILLFVFDWKFGIASLIPLALAFSQMFKMVGPDLNESMKAYQDALTAMSNEAVEYIRGIPVVKTFGQTVYSFHRFHKTIKDYEKFAIGYTNKMRIPMTTMTLFINSIFIFLIGLVIIMILNGMDITMHISDFIFYVIFTPILAVTANKIMFASENTMLAQDALERIHSITDQVPFTYGNEKTSSHDIEFKNVSFHYPGSQENVLKNVSFKIKENQTVAFVGESGGGKTTLVSLIPRFYDVSEGDILIGNQSVKNMSEEELMTKISFVFQDSHLLKRSILDNVKMGKNASIKEVQEALKQAQCEDIVAQFPQGIDTLIGSEGTYLSGGECQRIAIARAILKNAPILLLDEASAFADPDNEVKMQEALTKLSKGKTTIMIAHRLSTVQYVDCIYVLDKGRIIESGRHDDLIKQKGQYYHMWNNYCQSINWKIGEDDKL